MAKNLIAAVILILIVVAAAGLYLYYAQTNYEIPEASETLNFVKTMQKTNNSPDPADAMSPGQTDSAPSTSKNDIVTIPETISNPVENKPDINPATNTNPLRKVKTNPFE